MKWQWGLAVLGVVVVGVAVMVAQGPPGGVPSTGVITVTGRGDASAAPDQAVLRVAVVAQAPQAAAAQNQVNQVAAKVIQAITAVNIPADHIMTQNIEVTAIYEQPSPEMLPQTRPVAPRVIGYRAAYGLQIKIDQIALVGPVIDAAMAGGVNQIDELTFRLQDDSYLRQQALHKALRDARGKAQATASTLEVQLESLQDMTETSVFIGTPRVGVARGDALTPEGATPLEPGQLSISSSVTLQYRVRDAKR